MKILRTMGILALVAGLLLGGAGGVFADEEPELAEIEGVIKAIDIDTDDTEAGTVTILPEEGETVTLTIITGETEIKKDGVTATINDLAKDDEVEALYNPETLEAVEIAAKSPEPAENGGRAGDRPEPGPHSPKHGLFGTVLSPVETIIEGEEYVISLETEDWGTVDVTADGTTRYMAPTKTKGPVDLAGFVAVGLDGDIANIEGRRLALLVTWTATDNSTADAIKLMLIPSPGSSPSWGHRVGVVDSFTLGEEIEEIEEIIIVDKDGESYTFTLSEDTVYRPDDIDMDAIIGGCVTVVTKGDPKTAYTAAKVIVLHDDMPEWAPD